MVTCIYFNQNFLLLLRIHLGQATFRVRLFSFSDFGQQRPQRLPSSYQLAGILDLYETKG
jgi:hypothetical protein